VVWGARSSLQAEVTMSGPSAEWQEYARALRWLRDIGETLAEARYHASTHPTLLEHIVRLETAAKAWVAEATRKMNDAILKRERGSDG
jgi:hypothetical protein